MLLHVMYIVYIASNDLTHVNRLCSTAFVGTEEIMVCNLGNTSICSWNQADFNKIRKNIKYYRNCLINVLSRAEIVSNKQHFALHCM